MGISWIHRSELYHLRKMRFLVVAVALSGAAYAQVDVVDPRLTAPYAYGLDTFGGKSAPCVNGANLPVPCAGAPLAYAGDPYAPVAYGKRSADAEPEAEADADALYGYYGYPYGYRAYGYGYGYPYRYGYYGKRSADAEPEADADAYYGYYGYPYGYRAYGYGYPYRYYGKRSAEAAPQVLTYGAGVLPYAA